MQLVSRGGFQIEAVENLAQFRDQELGSMPPSGASTLAVRNPFARPRHVAYSRERSCRHLDRGASFLWWDAGAAHDPDRLPLWRSRVASRQFRRLKPGSWRVGIGAAVHG